MGKAIDIRRVEKYPGPIWRICGQYADYGLFSTKKPKELAIRLIHDVFTDEEIATKRFVYYCYKYRGRQSMKDEIVVFWQRTALND